jgi:hypothetical protein
VGPLGAGFSNQKYEMQLVTSNLTTNTGYSQFSIAALTFLRINVVATLKPNRNLLIGRRFHVTSSMPINFQSWCWSKWICGDIPAMAKWTLDLSHGEVGMPFGDGWWITYERGQRQWMEAIMVWYLPCYTKLLLVLFEPYIPRMPDSLISLTVFPSNWM